MLAFLVCQESLFIGKFPVASVAEWKMLFDEMCFELLGADESESALRASPRFVMTLCAAMLRESLIVRKSSITFIAFRRHDDRSFRRSSSMPGTTKNCGEDSKEGEEPLVLAEARILELAVGNKEAAKWPHVLRFGCEDI